MRITTPIVPTITIIKNDSYQTMTNMTRTAKSQTAIKANSEHNDHTHDSNNRTQNPQ